MYHILGTAQYLCHVTRQVYIRCQYIIPSGLGTFFCMWFTKMCTDSTFISEKMLKSENVRKKGYGLWNPLRVMFFALPALVLLLPDHLRSQDKLILLLLFAPCQVCTPSASYICIKLLPGTPALSVSKQPPLLFMLNEQSPPPLRPSVPFPSHTQPCLACGARVSSLSCTWFLFGCQHSERLLAAIALGLHTSKWVLMSAQHKHKYIRKRCMGVKHRMPPLQSPEELASSSILR